MKKNVFGRHFKRDANERKALFKNLLTSLVLEERIVTSEAKAKAIRSAADKLVTKAKKGGTEAYMSLAPDIRHVAVEKLIKQIAPLFSTRVGGYTRIIKIGNRVADNSREVIMEWVERPVVVAKPAKSSAKQNVKKGLKVSAKQKPSKVAKQDQKAEVKATTLGKPVKEVKKVKGSAPKQMVTRQKKG